jgi:hypothetical protein
MQVTPRLRIVFYDEIIKLVRICAAADPRKAFAAVGGAALRILFNERIVAGFLDTVRNLVQRPIPRDIFPMIGPVPANLRFQQPPRIQDVLVKRCSFRAQRSAVSRMIRTAFDVDP